MYVGPSPKFPNLVAPCSDGAKPAEIQLKEEKQVHIGMPALVATQYRHRSAPCLGGIR